ncbi:MAG: UDP-N-acetylglucosamine 1-carboxyvinyltransferase [Erysipelotrichaceae bacterium]
MEEVIVIEGGSKLEGSVRISGSKNATVALIPATILANGPITIYDVPDIADVESLSHLLSFLNVEVHHKGDHIIIDPTYLKNIALDNPYVSKLRASYYFMGALLGKFKEVKMKMPGGCYLGPRPIDLHLKGFEALGATITNEEGYMHVCAKELIGTKIYLDIASVGATINIMMAAVYAKGRTVIENAAKEPEIIDVSSLLNKMGAQVRGAGTNVITIDGVETLHGCTHEIIPDRIEAGTYIIMAAACAKHMEITNVIPQHLEALLLKLEEMNVNLEIGIDKVVVKESEDLQPIDIKTQPYPGFPTDLQQPLSTLLTKVNGTSKVKDTIYPERFKNCVQLQRMGANIDLSQGSSSIHGRTDLYAEEVEATDLRCGAALVIAGLMAKGQTTIREIYHIDRGYDDLDGKLNSLGATIRREKKY